jgi:hypothetical protein
LIEQLSVGCETLLPARVTWARKFPCPRSTRKVPSVPLSFRSRPTMLSSDGGLTATGRAGAGPDGCMGPAVPSFGGAQSVGGTPGTPGGGGGSGRLYCGTEAGGGGNGLRPKSRSKKPCAAAGSGRAAETASTAAKKVRRNRSIKR